MAMPKVSAFVDQLRAALGHDQVRVIYASENGREVGKRSDDGATFDAVPWAAFLRAERAKR